MAPRSSPELLLVYPSAFYFPEGLERLAIKTPLLWMASYLAREFPIRYADFEIEVGRPNTRSQIKRFLRRVRAYLSETPYDVLALSCWTSLSYLATVEVAKISRELYPDCPIVVGGYHPSARPNDFLEPADLFDYIVISGGEKQRLCLARTILRNPPIVILDEATSAIDRESEKAIQNALLTILRDKTAILIAHRFSSIQHADRIVVLQQGKIVDEGSHEALLKHSALYRKLADGQQATA